MSTRIGGRALAGLLPDLRNLPGPVYAALAHAITSLVLDGRIATDAQLPSERDLAAALRCSRATVTAAYDTLRADGFLASRTGSGSFVTVPAGLRPRGTMMVWTPAAPAADVIDLSCATLPAPEALFPEVLDLAAARLPPYLRDLGYEPSGLDVLRAAIADRYTARGVPTRPEQILVTNGAQHAFDLLLRLLVTRGDRVLTELPSYPGALDAIRAAGARVLPVPMAMAGGWQVEALQSALRQSTPHLAYLMPDFHNPTGALVPDADRRAVFTTARQSGTTVVIDESFVEFGFAGHARPSAAIDPHVVTVGSLSKLVWGGLRIGWVRGSGELVQRLAALRTTLDMSGPIFEQLIATELFSRLPDLVAARAAELAPRRDALVAALARELPQWQVNVPLGGLSLWAELDSPQSTALTLHAARAGVIVVPGSRFGVDGTLERFLRLPFAAPVEQLEEAVRRLAAAWRALDGAVLTRPRVVA